MKITEYGITVVYLMILCRIAYADWKYQIIEPWTHIGILTLACMEMLFRVGVSVQERCLGAVVIAVPIFGVDSYVKRRIWRRRYKADGGIRFPERRESYHICRNLGNHIERHICKHDVAAGKMGRKDSFALGPFLVMGIIGMKLWTSIS